MNYYFVCEGRFLNEFRKPRSLICVGNNAKTGRNVSFCTSRMEILRIYEFVTCMSYFA